MQLQGLQLAQVARPAPTQRAGVQSAHCANKATSPMLKEELAAFARLANLHAQGSPCAILATLVCLQQVEAVCVKNVSMAHMRQKEVDSAHSAKLGRYHFPTKAAVKLVQAECMQRVGINGASFAMKVGCQMQTRVLAQFALLVTLQFLAMQFVTCVVQEHMQNLAASSAPLVQPARLPQKGAARALIALSAHILSCAAVDVVIVHLANMQLWGARSVRFVEPGKFQQRARVLV